MAITIQASTSDIVVGRQSSGGGEVEEITCTSAGRALLDDADAGEQRTTLSVREKLTANRTYYVRTAGASNPGNDSNDGLTNDADGAFLTIQHGINVIAGLDIDIYDVTLQIADDNNINEALTLRSPVGSGTFTIQGNSGTPSNVVINASSGDCFSATSQNGRFIIKDLKMTTSVGSALNVIESNIDINNVDFGTVAGAHVFALAGSVVRAVGNYAVSGNATYHISGQQNGVFDAHSRTITYSNNPAFSTQNFRADSGSCLVLYSMTFTNGGTVTGQRYRAAMNALIATAGVSPDTYLPGNSNGTTVTGGQCG